MRIPILTAILIVAPAFCQMRDNTQPRLTCNDNSDNGRLTRFCQMREQTIPNTGQLAIDGRDNGGVSVLGSSRGDVLVRMRIEASGSSDAEAQTLASQVRVSAGAGRISADGPANDSGHQWSVSYEVFVPHDINLDLTTHNGGVHLSDVRGNIQFSAVNGGVHLTRIAGNVHGQTTNGGLHIELAGSRWDGQGMEVSTTNGGVHLEVPENYSARLEGSTVNGGMHSDFAGMVQAKNARQISANLGGGGAVLSVKTMNGGVHVSRI
jgi:DUF4097 and DUF4098 domain-containing protein YvlB